MSAHLDLISTALVTKMTANAALNAQIAGRYFDTQIPDVLPAGDYVLFQGGIAGGLTNDIPREGVEITYLVKYVSTVQLRARQGIGLVHDALHNQSLSITGWSNWRMEASDLVTLPPERLGTTVLWAYACRIEIAIDNAT